MRHLKKSTAANLVIFMTDSSDHVTGKTGLTLTITASKDGGAFGSITPTVTELSSGWYSLALTTTHTNTAGALALHITATGADPTDLSAQVLDNLPGELNSTAVQSIWDALTSALSTSGSIGKLLVDNVNATISSRSTLTSANVWDYLSASASTANSIGKRIVDYLTGDIYARIGAPSGASVSADIATIAGYIDTEVGAIKAKTDNLPSDPADASDIAASFSTVNSTLSTIAGYIDTEVAAIKAKTDNLPSDPADASDIAASFSTVNSTLSTIAGYIDTEVSAIKAKTDNLPASPAATGDIPSASTIASAVWDKLTSAISTVGSIGKLLKDNITASISDVEDIVNDISSQVSDLDAKVGNPNTTTVCADIFQVQSTVEAVQTAVADVQTSVDSLIGSGGSVYSLQKNTAKNDFQFPMYDEDGEPAPGLTVVSYVSKDGGAFVQSTNAAAEISDGWYKIDLTADELNADTIALRFRTASGAKDTNVTLLTES